MLKKLLLVCVLFTACAESKRNAVVFQTDFGLENNAVASMLGVAAGVDSNLALYNLTHDIPSYDVWTAALTLASTVEFWPKGTVFVSVVDPGVGTVRTSVVAKTKSGHYIVTPDNGTLTFIAEQYGIEELREISEDKNRRANTEESYTFHGRDVYSYTAARLASGVISYEEVGGKLEPSPVLLPYNKTTALGDNTFEGTIYLIDEPYGNIWSNIDRKLFLSEGIQIGDNLDVKVWNPNGTLAYTGTLPYHETFGNVEEGDGLAYINSLYNLSLALNMGDFARTHNLDKGMKIQISKK